MNSNRTRLGTIFICFNLILLFSAAIAAFGDIFYSFCLENNLDKLLALFVSLGAIIGGLLWAKICRNIKNPYFFCFLNIPLGLSLLSVVLFRNLWITITGYFLAGFIGIIMMIGYISFIKNVTEIESRGRNISLIVTCNGVFYAFYAIASVYIPNSIHVFMIISGVFILLGGISFFLNQKYSLVNVEKKEEGYIQDLNNRDIICYSIPIFLAWIVVGLFTWQVIVNPVMHQIASEAGALFFGGNAYTVTGMENTNFFIALTMVIMAYPVGVLMDRIGRTKLILIGLFITCIGLFAFAFSSNTLTMVIAWIFFGIEFAIFFNIVITVFLDIDEKRYKSFIGVPWAFMFGGLGLGHLIGELTKSFTFSYVALVVLVTFPSAIIAILHAKDSLPSKDEREWRSCINHLFLIAHTGVCLVHQAFRKEKLVDKELFAGGISGMIALIQELTKSDERIEVFSQKNKKIIIHYGKYLTGALISSKDLKILHQKLEELLYNYEDIFQDYFETWTGEISQFDPGIHLIKRFFT